MNPTLEDLINAYIMYGLDTVGNEMLGQDVKSDVMAKVAQALAQLVPLTTNDGQVQQQLSIDKHQQDMQMAREKHDFELRKQSDKHQLDMQTAAQKYQAQMQMMKKPAQQTKE